MNIQTTIVLLFTSLLLFFISTSLQGTPSLLQAQVNFFSDFMSSSSAIAPALLQTQFLADAGAMYSTSPFRLTSVGQHVNSSRTQQGLGISLRKCSASSKLQESSLPCSDPVPSVKDPNDESMTPLAWGLGAGILFVNILAAILLWRGYTVYEMEAASKQEIKIQKKLAEMAAQGNFRSSLMAPGQSFHFRDSSAGEGKDDADADEDEEGDIGDGSNTNTNNSNNNNSSSGGRSSGARRNYTAGGASSAYDTQAFPQGFNLNNV